MNWLRLLRTRRSRVWVMETDGRVVIRWLHRVLPRFSKLK